MAAGGEARETPSLKWDGGGRGGGSLDNGEGSSDGGCGSEFLGGLGWQGAVVIMGRLGDWDRGLDVELG